MLAAEASGVRGSGMSRRDSGGRRSLDCAAAHEAGGSGSSNAGEARAIRRSGAAARRARAPRARAPRGPAVRVRVRIRTGVGEAPLSPDRGPVSDAYRPDPRVAERTDKASRLWTKSHEIVAKDILRA